MFLSSQINPIKVTRGYIAISIPDWSQVGNNSAVYDFSAANVTRTFRQVAGFWVDNTANTNSVSVNVNGSNQNFKIYGGEQATFPVFSTDYPRITVTCNNDVTPNVGSTQFIFTDFDIGFNIAQTASGASIAVTDSSILTFSQSANDYFGKKIINAAPPVVNVGLTTSQIVLVAGSQQIFGIGRSRGCIVQNISVDPVYLAIGTGAVASSTNGSFKIGAGAAFSTYQYLGFNYSQTLYVCPTNAGDTINLLIG